MWTARMMAAQKTRNWALSCGLSPGSSRLPWLLLPNEKLTCLPEPLTPANGFSWKRHSMPCCLATVRKSRHQHLLVVGGEVGALEDGRDLELAGGDLVVAGLGRDAELEERALGVVHEGQHAVGDGAEVVVVELLALGRLGAEEGATGVEQVGAQVDEGGVDQEVLLLGAAVGDDVVDVLVAEELQDAGGLVGHRLLRAQERRLVVEGLAGPSRRRWSGCTACCRWGSRGCTPATGTSQPV